LQERERLCRLVAFEPQIGSQAQQLGKGLAAPPLSGFGMRRQKVERFAAPALLQGDLGDQQHRVGRSRVELARSRCVFESGLRLASRELKLCRLEQQRGAFRRLPLVLGLLGEQADGALGLAGSDAKLAQLAGGFGVDRPARSLLAIGVVQGGIHLAALERGPERAREHLGIGRLAL
jgi:hypothetical protein